MKKILTLILLLSILSLACSMEGTTTPSRQPPVTSEKAPVSSADAPELRVCGSGGLYLRSGPGTAYEVVTSAGRQVHLNDGELVTSLETETASDGGEWAMVVTSAGLTGHVNAKYLCERHE